MPTGAQSTHRPHQKAARKTARMAAYTCWHDVLDDITARLKKSKALVKFTKLKTNEERVDFCLRDDVSRNKVQQWLSIMSSSRHRKYWEKASELRADGNVCFQEKEYEKAVELYSQSILAAPFPDSEEAGAHGEELSLGYGNRSAALFHLQKYKECLEDVERAIKYNYPKELRFKLLQRKGQCYVKLSQPTLALEAFDESIKLLQDARLDSRKIARLRKDIESSRNAVEASESNSKKETEENTDYANMIPSLSHGSHLSLSSASAALDVQYDKHKGRYIVANRPIAAGDTLFVEVPYASVLLPNHYTTHCHHCYVRVVAVVPCHQCSQVRYCSEACCDESWEKYHKWECGSLDLFHTVGLAHLSCRVILVTGLERIKEFREELTKSSDAAAVPSSSSEKCYDNSYRSVYNLVTHIDDMHVEDTLRYALTALLMLLLFDKLNYFSSLDSQTLRDRLTSCTLTARIGSAPSTPTHKSRSPVHSRLSVTSIDDCDVPSSVPSTELFTGGLILHHIVQLVCNASAITQLQVTPQSGDGGSVLHQRQVKIATGIFPSASLMNHSCKPNVISSFHKNILIIRAVEDMDTGDEVLNCYGPHYRRMLRENRQRALLEQYFFLCDCEACVTEDDREQKFQALKCTFCSGPLAAPDSTNRAACYDCGKSQDCTTLLQVALHVKSAIHSERAVPDPDFGQYQASSKVFTAHDMFVQGLQLAAKGSYKDALERLKRCHKTREKVMYRYNRQLAEVRDQLACCYATLGKMMLAVDYLRPTLETTEQIYGSNSIELANELQKYSDLLINAIAQLSKEGPSYKDEMKSLIEEVHEVMDRSYRIFAIHYGPYHEALRELREKKEQLKAFEE